MKENWQREREDREIDNSKRDACNEDRIEKK